MTRPFKPQSMTTGLPSVPQTSLNRHRQPRRQILKIPFPLSAKPESAAKLSRARCPSREGECRNTNKNLLPREIEHLNREPANFPAPGRPISAGVVSPGRRTRSHLPAKAFWITALARPFGHSIVSAHQARNSVEKPNRLETTRHCGQPQPAIVGGRIHPPSSASATRRVTASYVFYLPLHHHRPPPAKKEPHRAAC